MLASFGVGAAATSIYLIGAGRSLSVDASVTVHNFVATDSVLAPITEQVNENNHLLFSLVERLLFAAGLDTPALMKVAPALFAGATVALVSELVRRRLGWLPALAGAAVLAANPMFVELARDVRGYSMLTFFVVASTAALLRLRTRPTGSPLLYVALAAGAVGTHLYGLLALAVHVGLLGREALSRRWFCRVGSAVALGLLPYAWILGSTLERRLPCHFRDDFLLVAGKEVLGRSWSAVA